MLCEQQTKAVLDVLILTYQATATASADKAISDHQLQLALKSINQSELVEITSTTSTL